MSAAARIVKPGGAIIAVAECSDGLPDHGNFKQLLQMRRTPQELLDLIESPGFELYDQWEAQTQAIIQRKAAVYLYSSLDPQTVRNAMLTPIDIFWTLLYERLDRSEDKRPETGDVRQETGDLRQET